MLNCRWCTRPVDLPLGDECAACQTRLNSLAEARIQVATRRDDITRISSYFQGCDTILMEDNRPVVKLEWDHNTTASNVRQHFRLFFKHARRIQIERLGGLRKERRR